VNSCVTPLPFEQLVDYWFAEGSTAQQAQLEEHVMACASCSARLQKVALLSAGMKALVASGDFGAVLTGAFVTRLRQAGLRVREYRVPPGGNVACTIAPDDDVVVGRLRAPLGGIQRLDLLVHDAARPGPSRLEDVPFDAATGEVLFTPGAAYLRTLDTHTQRIELVSVADGGDRHIGNYTFNHHRYPG
jgi:hypothetical protein